MAELPPTPTSLVPYSNFWFRLKCDGQFVGGFTKVSPLTASSTGAGALRSAGQTEYAPITLEKGITYDVPFGQWCSKMYETANSGGSGATAFRRDFVLEVYNEAGDKVLGYTLSGCWASEFTAMPELDGLGNALVIESLVLQNNGWEREAPVGLAGQQTI